MGLGVLTVSLKIASNWDLGHFGRVIDSRRGYLGQSEKIGYMVTTKSI